MSLSFAIVQYLKLTDDVVVVFAPGDVQHGALVPGHQRVVRGHAAKLKYIINTKLMTNECLHLGQRHDQEGSTSP